MECRRKAALATVMNGDSPKVTIICLRQPSPIVTRLRQAYYLIGLLSRRG
jgi:hypothetical protein